MTEVRDPAIKLFGKTIPVWESQISSEDGDKSYPECQISSDSDEMDVCREIKKEEFDGLSKKYLNDVKEDNQTPTQESKETIDPKLDEDQAGTDMDDQEKTLKKPDKIIPCPRCNSLDTKFCYYNNYNVSQPRHFCKNCQRYWTAGGTMRNVPVGAGRRKNKHAASQYRHIMMSPEGISTTRVETSDSANHQSLSSARLATPLRSLDGNRTVLKFGPDAPLSESMDTVLNLGDQKRNVELGSAACGENGEEPSSCGSSVSASACGEIKFPENVPQMEHGGNCNGLIPTHPLQPYSGPPWGYAWNPSWNNMTAMGPGRCSSDLVYGPDSSNSNPVQWGSPPMVAAPGFYASSMPFPILPGSYWGCIPSYVPWVGSNGNLYPAFTTSNSSCSGNDSPTLGKHSRDANIQGEKKPEKSLWAPKTLRIDDPDEAAKSSIWATLGIRPDQTEPFKRSGIFRAFQPRTEGKDHHTSDAAHVLHANPAALSRSQTFQEST